MTDYKRERERDKFRDSSSWWTDFVDTVIACYKSVNFPDHGDRLSERNIEIGSAYGDQNIRILVLELIDKNWFYDLER